VEERERGREGRVGVAARERRFQQRPHAVARDERPLQVRRHPLVERGQGARRVGRRAHRGAPPRPEVLELGDVQLEEVGQVREARGRGRHAAS
jgi:hypothetical protein